MTASPRCVKPLTGRSRLMDYRLPTTVARPMDRHGIPAEF